MPDSPTGIQTGTAVPAGSPARTAVGMTLALTVALTVGFFAVSSARARPEMAGENAKTRFTAMDTDKNGTIGREEFFAAQPNMKEGAFAAIDADGDGALTLKEWSDFALGHSRDGGMGGAPSLPPGAGGPPGAPSPNANGGSGAPQVPALIMPPADAR